MEVEDCTAVRHTTLGHYCDRLGEESIMRIVVTALVCAVLLLSYQLHTVTTKLEQFENRSTVQVDDKFAQFLAMVESLIQLDQKYKQQLEGKDGNNNHN